MTRLSTLSGLLARRGFHDVQRAVGIVGEWLGVRDLEEADDVERLLDEALESGDPDLALAGLAGIGPQRRQELLEDDARLFRTVAVLGGSRALNQHLCRFPDDVALLDRPPHRRPADEHRRDLLGVVGADPDAASPVATLTSGDELRFAYRRSLLQIAARDLTHVEPESIVDDIAGELADLADAAVHAALAIARAQTPDWELCRFAIIALGKCGAQELNYISDIDVLYVAEPALDADGAEVCSSDRAVTIAGKLAGAVSRICSAHTGAGTLWQVDAALRPEGKAGPLVRTLASHRAYYEKWAKAWEFQAMLKARPMAGDREVGGAFCAIVEPLVWKVGDREGFVAETQAMRQRVISLIPAKEADREIKLSAGGLRDTEFSVQLLQLVHGRGDERIHGRATLPSLRALVDAGYVGRRDGAELDSAYRFQRLLEHRVQLDQLRRTHLMPADEPGLRRLARILGLRGGPDEVTEQWRQSARRVRRLQQHVFYSPLLAAVARISGDELRLSTDAAQARLRALGYADPKAALRHIEALSSGLSRSAEIQRQLLPAMLGWFAAGPNPDYGLLAFRQVSEQLGSTPWYLRALRDEGAMAERLASILSSSRFAVDLVKRAPQSVQLLGDVDDLTPAPTDDLAVEMDGLLSRHGGAAPALEAVRSVRRRELFRIAAGDLLSVIDVDAVGCALSDLTSVTVDAALRIACREVPGAPAIALVALGRWGGDEMSYASDADVMFVVADADDQHEATRAANQVVSKLREMLHRPGPDPALDLDADLRPEGKSGPLVRSLSSFRAYYGKLSATWEAQALLRARHGAGDRALTQALIEVIDQLRYPEHGLDKAQLSEIRRLKGRMESERLPRGADPRRHLKLGPGGLSDVEWTVQLMQLRHGAEVAGLRTTKTLDALAAAVASDLIDAADAETLTKSWTLASRIRNAIMLVRGRPSDSLPSDAREVAAIAEVLGYGKGESSMLVDDYSRTTRRARAVVDRLFWGVEAASERPGGGR